MDIHTKSIILNKLVVPISIVLGCLILGGSFFAVQVNKANSIERQNQADIDFQKEVQAKAEAKEKLNSTLLNICLDSAEDNYWNYMELNGTGKRNDEKGVWAQQYVWDRAEKNKQAEISNCYKKYKE